MCSHCCRHVWACTKSLPCHGQLSIGLSLAALKRQLAAVSAALAQATAGAAATMPAGRARERIVVGVQLQQFPQQYLHHGLRLGVFTWDC